MTSNGPRSEQVLALITAWPEDHGHAPTYRELAEVIGCSVATVHWHVANLIRDGRVTYEPNKMRTIRAV